MKWHVPLAVCLAWCFGVSCRSGDGPSEDRGPGSTSGAVFGDRVDFFEPIPIGDPPGDPLPWITNLAVVDLDQDGRLDVVLCDAIENQIRWIRQTEPGVFVESQLGSVVIAPAHVTPSDIDQDGDIDLLVAEMGQIYPTNAKIGAVNIFENQGSEQFEAHVLIDSVARVTDIQPGDFDDDGDLDLAVAQFGYDDGEIRWMENLGGWRFESHSLLSLPGTIHVPVADMDGDGDLDITAIVSQTYEQVYVFDNDGSGGFESHIVFGATNEDYGSSGISLADLDGDGDPDVLYTNGDAFDYTPSLPRPWHGVQWIENRGGLDFTHHPIGELPGAFSARALDVDHDGDLDVMAVSLFADWSDPDAWSMVLFENDGSQSFTVRVVANEPTHLVILEEGDFDGDGFMDVVTGGLYSHEPWDRNSRVTWWRNDWASR